MNLERHLKVMFEEALHSDQCLTFRHSKHSAPLVFHVHKSILSQSDFFRALITPKDKLTLHLSKEWARCGFHNYEDRMTFEQLKTYIESMLKWFYCIKKEEVDFINNSNVLDVLSLAILFDISPIYNECVDIYIRKIDMDCIMRDVNFLCHFPQQHPAYIKLRDHILLILFRSNNPVTLAQLPIDYLSRVISSDLLFVSNEFHRYFLLKRVLYVIDPDNPLLRGNKSNDILPFLDKHLVMTTSEARSQKRKRALPQQDEPDKTIAKRRKLEYGNEYKDKKVLYQTKLDDDNSLKVDKFNMLTKLLKSDIYYSNMTFKQLSMVREDGIVDEDILFRALWEKETLERIIKSPSTTLKRFRFSSTVLVTSPQRLLYSNPEKLPFGSYRVQVETEVEEHHLNCKFRLHGSTQTIYYWIYCFNNEGEHQKPVTVQEASAFQCRQISIPTDFKETLRIDVSVVGDLV